jgi:hypothetical protein
MTEQDDYFASPSGGFGVPPAFDTPAPYPAPSSNAALARPAVTATDDLIYALCAAVVLISSFLPWVRVKVQFSFPGLASGGSSTTSPFATSGNQDFGQLAGSLGHGLSASTNAWNAGAAAEIGVVLAMLAGFLVLLRPAATWFRVGPHVIMAIVALVAGIFIAGRWASLPSRSIFGITAKATAGSGLVIALLAAVVMVVTAAIGASRRGELG